MSEGALSGANMQNANRAIASIADWYTCRNLSISGVASTYLVDIGGANYVDCTLLWTGYKVKGFGNQSSTAAATAILHSVNDVNDGVAAATREFTISIGASQSSGKLPSIRYIKVSGTSDNLTVFLQKA